MAGQIFMRVDEVAAELGVSKPYAYKLIKNDSRKLLFDTLSSKKISHASKTCLVFDIARPHCLMLCPLSCIIIIYTYGGDSVMTFSEQFKKLRAEQNITQEQVASKLNVSRQAVSHWENNKNLPNLEILVNISDAFGISLNQLILGNDRINDMAEKLIKDGGETRRAKINLISFMVGTILLLLGMGCIWIKANAVEYIDTAGIVHESFFLIPIGMMFMFCGVVTFLVIAIRSIRTRCCKHTKKHYTRKEKK